MNGLVSRAQPTNKKTKKTGEQTHSCLPVHESIHNDCTMAEDYDNEYAIIIANKYL